MEICESVISIFFFFRISVWSSLWNPLVQFQGQLWNLRQVPLSPLASTTCKETILKCIISEAKTLNMKLNQGLYLRKFKLNMRFERLTCTEKIGFTAEKDN